MDADRRICSLDEVSADATFLFTVHDGDEEREAILTRLDDGTVVGFENYCQHWTDVRLDTGDGAPTRNGELVCAKHGATFERDSGFCTFGPCEGAYLTAVEVTAENGAVYLVDDDYTFVRRGGAERDPTDLSTSPGERLGF